MNELQTPNKSLVLVSDGQKALFLRNRGTARQVDLVVENTMTQSNPPTRELGTDKPGRRAGAGSARGAIEETDRHQQAEDRFAGEIADSLYKGAHEGAYDRLIIVASPTSLGVLRQRLHNEVTEKVIAEIPKTLTQHTVTDIQKILASP